MDLGDTCLLQFKHERLLRWLAYMKVNNTEVGDFLSVVYLIPISTIWIFLLKSRYQLLPYSAKNSPKGH